MNPADSPFLRDVLGGLSLPTKQLSAKFFYDERGSELFEQITLLKEYYPTQCEVRILRDHGPAIASRLPGPDGACVLIEYGSGSSLKIRLLLDRLDPARTSYVPVDISGEHLARAAEEIQTAYPELEVAPVAADFMRPFDLPPLRNPGARRVVYFSGSTIGNFTRDNARALLRGIADEVGPHGGLLIGVDLIKDVAILERAYDDARGVTAAFNLNLLTRINRELGGDFDPEAFRHRAFYNREHDRIEMHLESLCDQSVTIAGHSFSFRRGETIHTENSHKYSPDSFRALAHSTGLEVEQVWTDPDGLFSVQYLERQ
jgi:L-histidine N-alpha-methyltransferase